MKRLARWTIVLAAAFGLAVPVPAAEETETDGSTTYVRKGNTYTVRNVFQTSCTTPELLAVCFDFKHLQQFYHGTEVRLVASGPNWQKLEYRTDYKIGTSTIVYKKTLDRAKGKANFIMLSYQATGWGVPAMTASAGSYTVTDDGKTRTLAYEQSVTLDREIGPLDWSLIKSKTRTFFTDFEAYVRQQEKIAAPAKPVPPETTPVPPAKPPPPPAPNPRTPSSKGP
jgi:hypothetical protein